MLSVSLRLSFARSEETRWFLGNQEKIRSIALRRGKTSTCTMDKHQAGKFGKKYKRKQEDGLDQNSFSLPIPCSPRGLFRLSPSVLLPCLVILAFVSSLLSLPLYFIHFDVPALNPITPFPLLPATPFHNRHSQQSRKANIISHAKKLPPAETNLQAHLLLLIFFLRLTEPTGRLRRKGSVLWFSTRHKKSERASDIDGR